MKGFMFFIMSICLCLTSCTERNGERLGIGYLEESKNEFFVVIENTKYSVPEVLCFNNVPRPRYEETIPFHGMLVTAVSYGNGGVKFFAGNVPQKMITNENPNLFVILVALVLFVYALCKLMQEQRNYERIVRECLHERELEEKKEV